MSAKKIAVTGANLRTFRVKLEKLYARRSAVDALIESLEQYDRCRSRRLDPPRRKTA